MLHHGRVIPVRCCKWGQLHRIMAVYPHHIVKLNAVLEAQCIKLLVGCVQKAKVR